MGWFWFLTVCAVAVWPSMLQAFPPVQISELAAAGRQALMDEDGDTPDWIELQNTSAAAVDLEGWVLAEGSRRPVAWTLPSTNLGPGEYLVLFASGKDRRVPGQPLHTNFKLPARQGSLSLRSPDGALSQVERYPMQIAGVSFGLAGSGEEGPNRIVLLPADAPLRYQIPTDDRLGTSWVAPEFTDARWRRGRNGIGYDLRGDHYQELLRTDLQTTLPGRATCVYLRIPIVLTSVPRPGVRLSVQYDDGFVAWLNGVEIARRNVPETSGWDTLALGARPDEEAGVPASIDLSAFAAHWIVGTNYLAVQVVNATLESSDLLFRTTLDQPPEPRPDTVPDVPIYDYLSEPTPGEPNSTPVHHGPRIASVSMEPLQPGASTNGLLVSARVSALHGHVEEVSLRYRVMFAAEAELPMHDDGQHGDGAAGDNLYAATIPPGAAKRGQLLRFYVIAKSEGQTSRWPLFADRPGYSAYEGTVIPDESTNSRLPAVQLFLHREQTPNGRGAPRFSLFYQGELYDNVNISSHGQISRGFPKNSLNVRFPHDHLFRYQSNQARVKRIAILANYADKSKIRNSLAYEMIAAAGSISHFAFPVRVEKNGKFYCVAEIVEHGDGRWMERVGRDPQGALYKMYNNLSGAHGAEKKTRQHENNRDLALLAAALSESRPLEQRAAYAYGHIDLPQCISYLVAMTLISSDDHGHKNYYLYRDTRGSGEWALLPWDVDLSWGRNWTGQYFNDTIFSDNPLDLYRNGRSKPNNRLYNLLFQFPEFREMYLRRLRTVMDEVLQPPGTPAHSLQIEKRIRALIELMDPPNIRGTDAELDQEAWPSWGTPRSAREEAHRIMAEHLPGRRQFLFKSSRAQLFGDRIPAPQPEKVAVEVGAIGANEAPPQQFVEVHNRSDIAVDLSGWHLRGGGIRHRFRPGTVLPRGKSMFVVANTAGFRRKPPTTAGAPPYFVQGNWEGTLTSGGEGVELVK